MSDRNLLNPRHLETFCAIVATGSFAQAAGQLHLSQPAVTQHVRSLEAALGCSLFNRTAAGLALTEAGEVLERYARRFLDLNAECLAAVRDAIAPTQGRLHLAVGLTIANTTLPSVLVDFRRRNPDVKVELSTGTTVDMVRLLAERRADLAVVSEPAPQHGLTITPLYDDFMILVVPNGHPWCRRTSISAREVESEPFVFFYRGSVYRPIIDATCERLGIRPNIVLELDSVEAVKRMVEAGLGVAMVPYRSTRLELERGSLVAVPVAENVPRVRSTCAVTPSGTYLTRPVRGFLALLREHLGTEAPPGSPSHPLTDA